jgi:hypothetical protein
MFCLLKIVGSMIDSILLFALVNFSVNDNKE